MRFWGGNLIYLQINLIFHTCENFNSNANGFDSKCVVNLWLSLYLFKWNMWRSDTYIIIIKIGIIPSVIKYSTHDNVMCCYRINHLRTCYIPSLKQYLNSHQLSFILCFSVSMRIYLKWTCVVFQTFTVLSYINNKKRFWEICTWRDIQTMISIPWDNSNRESKKELWYKGQLVWFDQSEANLSVIFIIKSMGLYLSVLLVIQYPC